MNNVDNYVIFQVMQAKTKVTAMTKGNTDYRQQSESLHGPTHTQIFLAWHIWCKSSSCTKKLSSLLDITAKSSARIWPSPYKKFIQPSQSNTKAKILVKAQPGIKAKRLTRLNSYKSVIFLKQHYHTVKIIQHCTLMNRFYFQIMFEVHGIEIINNTRVVQ